MHCEKEKADSFDARGTLGLVQRHAGANIFVGEQLDVRSAKSYTTENCPTEPSILFVPQRGHGIDASGAAGGDEGGDRRCRKQ
jgi:hypothetical protein